MRTLKTLLAIFCFVALSISLNAQTASWTYGNNAATLNPATANLGIGTTASSAYKLDVAGTTQMEKLLIKKPTTITNWNDIWQSGFFDANNATNAPESSGWFWGINMNHTSNTSTYRYGGQIAIHNTPTSPTMYFRSTDVNGSGTWTKVLHSLGNQYIEGRIAIYPQGTTSDGGYNGNLIITKPVNSGQYINLVRQGSHPWSIGTVYNNNTFAIGSGRSVDSQFTDPFFTINTSGNVGIGLTNPGTKLDIAGVVRAHEVKVCVNQGCDYVFSEDYNLMNLNDLSSFVKTNKHLPEIAPAVQMELDGINVSEMNLLLLKKVEELTLYVIELKNEIDDLKK